MKILLNTTKTMDPRVSIPHRLEPTQPHFAAEANSLMAVLQRYSRPRLAREMGLSAKVADETKAVTARWGHPDEPRALALFAFTGLVYKYVEPAAWTARQVRGAQSRLLILSGLYGFLRPLDNIAAYRLEMGAKFKPPNASNLVSYWREKLTAALNAELRPNEPVLNLAAQEYGRALDFNSLKGPVISPIFKETRPDGSLKTAPVYAKMARGALVRHIFTTGTKRPTDLLGFQAMEWEAATEPPAAGDWLFTRPVRD